MGRRMVRVPVHFDLFTHMITKGKTFLPQICTKGLPDDADFVGSYFDVNKMISYFFFRSDEFEEIGEADPVPEFVPAFSAYEPKNWGEIAAQLILLDMMEK